MLPGECNTSNLSARPTSPVASSARPPPPTILSGNANLLVLWRTDHSIVLLNRFPYANGHLLIAPRAHQCELEDLTEAEHLDLAVQTARAIRLLKRTVSAQGFNLGINLGTAAGAGLPGHVHQHLVPRWAGDTNFMSVVGETRVVPEALSQMYDELTKLAEEIRQ